MNGRVNERLYLTGDSGVSGFFAPQYRLNIIVGAFGSGKTEISVNWAVALSGLGYQVRLADLDIANPYFRSREVQQLLIEQGVTPVIPHGEVQFSDLPVLIPQIKGMLQRGDDNFSFFDVGGDEQGARVLASLRTVISTLPYSLFQVVNTRRPFTDTAAGCLGMKRQLETVSGLGVSGFIINTHLMEFTSHDVILEGIAIGRQIEAESGVPVVCVTVMDGAVDVAQVQNECPYPICVMNRRMLPPWLNHNAANSWPLAVTDRRG